MNEDKFAKGDVITPSSPRSVLEYGKTYLVMEYVQNPEGDVVFVEGHYHGVQTQYMWRAEEQAEWRRQLSNES